MRKCFLSFMLKRGDDVVDSQNECVDVV